jgi:protein phosphatase
MSRIRTAIDHRHAIHACDVIGDVHGCLAELTDLFVLLGYERDPRAGWRSPAGRFPIFVGDLVDRGPNNVGTLTLAMQLVDAGAALVVPGNHDLQLERHLSTGDAPLVYGLDQTVRELESTSAAFRADVLDFLQSLPGHVVVDDGSLVVAHAGLPQRLWFDDGAAARIEAAYGPDGLDMDPHDHSKRHPWISTHSGPAVVYGHTPVLEPAWQNDSLDIDTGCAFGWRLTALRWPERQLVSVPARRAYAKRNRPFLPHERPVAEPV